MSEQLQQYVVQFLEKETFISHQLHGVRKAFNIVLVTALVHLFPPKHHTRATRILAEVLSFEPENARALLARAYIFEVAKRWAEAAELSLRVSDYLKDNLELGLAACEEHTRCLSEQTEHATAINELDYVIGE